MALFTNKQDAKRPLLTKVSQLNIDDLEEVADFYTAQGDASTGEWIRVSIGIAPFPMPSHRINNPEAVRMITEAVNRHVEEILEILRLARRVMEDIGHHGRISDFDLQRISDHYPKEVFSADSAKVGLRDSIENAPDGSRYFYINDLSYWQFTGGMDQVTHKVIRDLKDTLATAIHTGDNPVGICPVCERPFIVEGGTGRRSKGSQIYCSYRCGHRVAVRTQYELLFPDEKER